MKATLIITVVTLLLVGVSAAQTSAPAQSGASPAPDASTPPSSSAGQAAEASQGSSAQNAENATGMASGTTIPAELTKSLDAKKNKQGDRVEARTTQDLLSRGQVVVPRGAKIIGHVTAVQPRAKGESSSMIGIAFDQLVMKGGKTLPMNAAVQAIAKPVQTALIGGSGNEPMSESGGMPGGMHGSVGAGAGRTGGYPSSTPGTGAPASPPTDTTSSPDQGPGGLSSGSSGVVGLKDLALSQGAQGSVISSDSQNVHLDSGTQLILRVK